jgi:hypothetical protein
MATKEYREKAPDGSEVRFTGPENASREQVLAAVKRAYEIKLAASAQAPAPAAPQAAAPQAAIPRGQAPMAASGFMPNLSNVQSPSPMKAAEFAADVGLEAGGAGVGRVVGSIGGPPGAFIGGGLGGVAGQSLSQLRRMAQGQQESFNPREALAAFPGGALAIPGFIQAFGKRLIAGIGVNTAADATQALIAGRDITAESLFLAAGGGAVGELTPAIRAMNQTNAELAALQAGINVKNQKQLVNSMEASINDGFAFIPSIEQRTAKNNLLEFFANRDELFNKTITNNQKIANEWMLNDITLPRGINKNFDRQVLESGGGRPPPVLNKEYLDQQIELAYAPYEDAEKLLPSKNGEAARLKLKSLFDQLGSEGSHPQMQAMTPGLNAPPIPKLQLMGGGDIIEELKRKRAQVKNLYEIAESGRHPDALAKARSMADDVKEIEDVLEKLATEHGQDGLVTRLKEARKFLARAYGYDSAFNATRGEVDPRRMRSLAENGVPFDGGAAKIVRFAQIADNYAKTASKARPMGTSGSGFRGAVFGSANVPVTASIRNMLLSREYQLKNAIPLPPQNVPTFANQLMSGFSATAGRNADSNEQPQ